MSLQRKGCSILSAVSEIFEEEVNFLRALVVNKRSSDEQVSSERKEAQKYWVGGALGLNI